jgi:hypothetical protein
MTATVVQLRDAQLTVDGREIPLLPDGRIATRLRLGPNQREVMRRLGLHGSIRAVQAGQIIHQCRGRCGFGAKDRGREYRGLGCCRYASTDGSALLRRLEKSGLVQNIGGVYYRVHDA